MADILPPVLVIKKQNFEKAFLDVIKIMISQKKMTTTEFGKLNNELTKWLITGMNNVDFDDKRNQMTLDSLADDLWKEFFRDLTLKVKKHRLNFVRKNNI